MKKVLSKRAMASLLSASMLVGLLSPFTGSLASVRAESGDVFVNGGFESDIWGEGGGWSTTASVWDGLSVNSFSYSEDSYMNLPTDQSAGAVKFYADTSDSVITFKQDIELEAGDYTFTVDGMGEGASFSVSVGDASSTGVDMTGYNNWLTDTLDYTSEGGTVTVIITVSTAVKGWGYINSITCEKAESYGDLVNPGFENDIWGETGGWSVSVKDDDWTGVSIKTFEYASDEWMDVPSDDSEYGLNVYSEGATTVTISQEVKFAPGDYTFSMDAMGDDGVNFSLSVGDKSSSGVDVTGYNNWLDTSVEYTADGSSVPVTITLDVSAGGWIYINSVTYEKAGEWVYPERTFTFDTTPVSGDPINSNTIVASKVDGLMQDFITGADISSYLSIRKSGVDYKDADGEKLTDEEFFSLLKASGVNCVRIRVWVDPYDADGNGYGGGNNDIETAKYLGKLATDAGLGVLIDFHYSDFWTDPGKQFVPKAWKNMTLDEKATALKTWTEDSLNALIENGVDVRMVQIGNETTNGFCGETDRTNMCTLFKAGSEGVQAVEESQNKNIMIVIHLTNPESQNFDSFAGSLKSNNVVYDVFATSYYPYWHGTLENLYNKLSTIAQKYDKYVMVAETSYIRTLDNGDGHDNTVRVGKNDSDLPYDVSEQGQVNHVRNVVEQIAKIPDNKGIGVFWWEPAWIPVQNWYDAENKDEVLQENKNIWETCGSGWASSYAAEYDPDDAGKWFGGSAVDNESWFDFDGKALDSINVFNYVRYGSTAVNEISEVAPANAIFEEGEDIVLPATVDVKYVDGTTDTIEAKWSEIEIEKAKKSGVGSYVINGTSTYNDEEVDVKCNLEITNKNLLTNPGFEDGSEGYTLDGIAKLATAGDSSKPTIHTGSKTVHWYNTEAGTCTVTQKATLKPGTYWFGGYVQGENGDSGKFTVSDENGVIASADFALTGWANWQNPETDKFTINEETEVSFVVEIDYLAEGWGDLDDLYLFHEHNLVQNEKVAPTCVDEGVDEYYECSVCGIKFADKDASESVSDEELVLAATGEHKWDKGVVTKEPTTKKTGVRTYTCTVCSTTKTETIDKLTEDDTTDDKSKDDKSTDDKSTDDKSTDDKSTDDKSTDDKSTDNKSTDDKSTDNNSSDNSQNNNKTDKNPSDNKEDKQPVKSGWYEDEAGWHYVKSDGSLAKSEFIDGYWLDSDTVWRYQPTGSWRVNDTGIWYEDTSGWYPVNMWVQIDECWYFFNEKGYKEVSCYRDGYWLDWNGAWSTMTYAYKGSWHNDAYGWWYEDESGWGPSDEWMMINGKWYYFYTSGYMAHDISIDGCYLGSDGAWVE